jgi:hypothetical protein
LQCPCTINMSALSASFGISVRPLAMPVLDEN